MPVCYAGFLGVLPLLFARRDAEVRWHARNGLALFLALAAAGTVATLVGILVPSLSCVYGRHDGDRRPALRDDRSARHRQGDERRSGSSFPACRAMPVAPSAEAPPRPAPRASLAPLILAAVLGFAVGDAFRPAGATGDLPRSPSRRSTSIAARSRPGSPRAASCAAVSRRAARPTAARRSRATAAREDSRSRPAGSCAATRGRRAGAGPGSLGDC